MKQYEYWHHLLLLLIMMIVIFLPFILIVKKIISNIISFIEKKNSKYAKLIKSSNISRYSIHIFIAIYLIFWDEIFYIANTDINSVLPPIVNSIKHTLFVLYLTAVITLLLLAACNLVVDIHAVKSDIKRAPIKLHIQIIKVLISVYAIIFIISNLLHISLVSLMTSLGAATAFLTFVFKDTVLGLLASLQLTLQDVLRIGDWVVVPQYDVEGVVIEITINVVKINNFDRSISILPTHALLNTNIKNWRAMEEAGGRRIKAALYIDVHSIVPASKELLKFLTKLPYISDILKAESSEFTNRVKSVNLGLFRLYAIEYLKQSRLVHNENFSFVVRELNPTPYGVPLEIYVFSVETDWAIYEQIKAAILDHLISMLPKFQLKSFQYNAIKH